MTETIVEMGVRLAQEKKWVFHPPSGVIGRVVDFFDGEEKVFVSTVNGFPVRAPIVQLESGHALLMKDTPNADDPSLIEISAQEVGVFLATTRAMNTVLVEVAKLSAEQGVPPDTAMLLMRSALQAQIAKLSPKAKAFG